MEHVFRKLPMEVGLFIELLTKQQVSLYNKLKIATFTNQIKRTKEKWHTSEALKTQIWLHMWNFKR